jgi:DNA-binding GntR family transcriptional regulator
VREALEVEAAKLFAERATPTERAELQRLAARVDALSTQAGDRFLYLSLHEKLHRRIAECTRCQPLCDAIEKNHVLASTWLCTPKPASAGPSHRHQDLVEALITGDRSRAADAMLDHVNHALQNTLQRLEPYFQMRETNVKTYVRSTKRSTATEAEGGISPRNSNVRPAVKPVTASD